MNKNAFTLIEVMVAVMIVTVVIAALIKVQSDSSYLFQKLKNGEKSQKYITLIMHSDYDLKQEHFTLDKTVGRFDIDDDLRRRLRNITIKLQYKKLQTIDLAKEEDNGSATGQNLQIGKIIVKLLGKKYAYIRIVNK